MEEKKAKMLKFIMGKGHQPTAERLKVQKELFGFNRSVRHGFPHKPSAMAWDPELRLLGIATKQGGLRIYGRPGVEFYGQHETESNVGKMVFLPGQARLVTLTEDNHLHLWEINGTTLQEKLSTFMDGRLKQISHLCPDMTNKKILLGTEGGNIYTLNLVNFSIENDIIYQDIVIANSTEEFKVNPGAVEALIVHPGDKDKLLIGYARGLIVLWNRKDSKAEKTYYANQQLESISLQTDGNQFISAHNDGSYIIWSLDQTEALEPPNTPYGPYPCKAITKIYMEQDADGLQWTAFCGGMPRASYGDKFTVTVMKGEEKHSVFDLTSKIIDFSIISGVGNCPQSLIILAEEELAVIDLTAETWPITYSLPYLNPIHASSITCLAHIANVKKDIFDKIQSEKSAKITNKTWPIDGGSDQTGSSDKNELDVLVTGHEDGSVKFWNCSGITLSLLAAIKTSKFFVSDDLDAPRDEEDMEEEEDEWPPFKKVGQFDPYSDDPRLAIKKVFFCGDSGKLIVGGTAGQCIIFDLSTEAAADADVPVIKTDLVTEKEGFTWKGHQALLARAGPFKMPLGFQARAIVQITPPASINSLVYADNYGLVAAGTAHGLVIVDSVQLTLTLGKCTLNAQDIANADDNPMSRRKSLKKSLRESFRRLRKGRSQRNKKKSEQPSSNSTTTDPIKRELPRAESPDHRPVERAVEARSGSEDGLGSMVRCLHFAETYIANPTSTSPTLWAGTNSGQILVFLLSRVSSKDAEKRKEEKVTALLGKEIQLKHRAPVLTIQVLDGACGPVTSKPCSSANPAPDNLHKVLIASEEQFKMFALPTLKPCGKYKLTAHEGARIRKIGFNTFVSKADAKYSEQCLTCLTNQGDLVIHSLPELRRQVIQTQCMRKEDMIGISTLVFTPKAEAFYLSSSSELARVSMAASRNLQPSGTCCTGDRFEISKLKSAPAPSSAPAASSAPKKMSTDDDSEAATVARQNQLNEQQAQGTASKSPVVNGAADPHNETTISEISADITLDSVKDHTMSQQQLLDSTLSSSTSKSSIKETVAKQPTIEEEPKEASKELNGASADNASSPAEEAEEDINGLTESLESTVLATDQIIPEHKSDHEGDETIVEEDKTHVDDSMLINETVHEKTIEVKENEANEERVSSDETEETPAAPLASLEPDPAPLASLESTTSSELPSM